MNPDNAYSLVLNKGADPKTGGVAVCGFTSTGMVGVIAASHIVNSLNIPQIGTVLNPSFPAIALVQDEVPKHPVRVYQNDELGVFVSEMQFPTDFDVQFAETVLNWFTQGDFERLIIVDGVQREDVEAHERRLHGVASTVSARNRLRTEGIELITQGVVAGISGYLLSEGDRLDLDITALLPECNPMFPDARAAALAVEAISELTQIEVPLSSLIEDARRVEESVQGIFEQSKNILPAPGEYKIPKDDSMFG
ncbi:MAG: proteasome assembly chaperone family protein [Euryarchaeota archaeon]|nr:proteasome assembly chaperone family protein [Euryarchaeota archaeon]MBT4408008.1 proteasome assembly chaperone family protein [Euryarchaeota archaeon]MBT6645118.1 proteasome assembly chaperone family protein [Euryarchaeota archaeon]